MKVDLGIGAIEAAAVVRSEQQHTKVKTMATVGLTAQEVAEVWNKALRDLNSKLAPIQAPPGVDVTEMERNPSVVRVPDDRRQAVYSVLVDMASAFMAVVDRNNTRIVEQLRAVGVDLPEAR